MKGLIAYIYTNSISNCSNNGISSKTNKVIIVGDNIPEIFESSDESPAVKIIKRNISGEYIHVEPVEPCPSGNIGYMAGGAFVYSGDSRFSELVCRYPVSLHDRSETQQLYDSMWP